MRDSRAFHIDDADWIEKYNQQGSFYPFGHYTRTKLMASVSVRFEAQVKQAWINEGPKVVMREAKQRLQHQTWDKVRPALSTTVRFVFCSRLHSCVCVYFLVTFQFMDHAWI